MRFVYKIDPRRNAVVRRVQLPAQSTVIALHGDGRALWSAGWWGVVKRIRRGPCPLLPTIDGSGWSLAQTPERFGLHSRSSAAAPSVNRTVQRGGSCGSARRVCGESRSWSLQTQPGHVSSADGVVWVTANGGLCAHGRSGNAADADQVPVDFSPNYHVAFGGGPWLSDLRANRVHKVC